MTAVSVRFNNPGALNTATWVKAYPGYEFAQETTRGNVTAAFHTKVDGSAAWFELIRRYRMQGITTVGGIITQYGGGQDYSAYVGQVCNWSGLLRSTVVHLDDDKTLLALAKAMYRYEAGQVYPMTDDEIVRSFALARSHAGLTKPLDDTGEDAPSITRWPILFKLVAKLFTLLTKR